MCFQHDSCHGHRGQWEAHVHSGGGAKQDQGSVGHPWGCQIAKESSASVSCEYLFYVSIFLPAC